MTTPPRTRPAPPATWPTIAQVGPDPASVGGIQTVIRTYAALLAAHTTVESVPTWRSDAPAAGAMSALGAMRRLAGLPADTVVHVHLSHRGAFLREGALVLMARASRRPVFVTVHGSAFIATSQSRTWAPIYRSVLRAADGVAVLNEGAERAVRGLAPGRPVTLLHNPGPVPEDWEPATTAELSPPVVVFAGEVSRRKGVDVLLDAWPMVLRAVPSARLVIAGPFADVTVTGMPGVQAVGAVSPERVRALLGEARAAVLPSRAEAMPMFVLEAMAAGRPVVGSTVGAMPMMLAGAGKVVAPGDAVQLREALTAYLADAGAAGRDGNTARARYLSDHAADVAVRRLRDFYRLPTS